MTPTERYDESDQATEDFAAWLVDQAGANPDHRMFDTARATWESSDNFTDCCDEWYREREAERRRLSEGTPVRRGLMVGIWPARVGESTIALEDVVPDDEGTL